MARRKSDEMVSFRRGGEQIQLYKAQDLFAVRLRDGSVPASLLERVGWRSGMESVRFSHRYPGQRTTVFHCPAGQRNRLMGSFRKDEQVLYCSHVLLRQWNDNRPGAEIGLDDKVFVELGEPPSRDQVSSIEQAHHLRAIWRFPDAPTGIVFQLTDTARENPIKIANAIAADAACRTAEPCLIDAKPSRAIPNDPGFPAHWHLLNTGQYGGIPGADCNATEAWDHTWGSPEITIALIDDGFDLDHPDFALPGKYRDAYDASERDTNPRPTEFRDNHGTSCAGVAVAARGGGLSIGVAPDCTLMPIRHAGRLGDFEEALAFYHAYLQQADVISCSWGPYDAYQNSFWPLPSLTRLVIDICAARGRGGKGIPVFFAAGNGNEPIDLDGYASYDKVIAVAACTNRDLKAGYSDYGSAVWVTAPSSGGSRGIFTTDRVGSLGYDWSSDYTTSFGGTSAAAPLVAGIAGLMLSVNPELTIDQIRQILKTTAVKINRSTPFNGYVDCWGATYSDAYDEHGHSPVYGWGRVNAGAAVAEAIALG